MPFKHIETLCKIAQFDVVQFSSLPLTNMPQCGEKIIKVPAQSRQLAEFLGLIAGDGCIVKSTYSTYVTCGAELDYDYVLNIVRPMFEELFEVSPHIRKQNGALHCWVNSKRLFNFILEKCNFPVGQKKNNLNVPSWISGKKEYSIAFLRGLFDTDGGVHRHHKNSIQLGFTSASPKFLKQVYVLLINLKLNPRLGEKDIWIFQKEKVNLFFKTIAPKNPKHLLKFEKFKELGVVPLSKDLLCDRRELNPAPVLTASL